MSKKKATWNHRVIEHRFKEEVWSEVHEVHYLDGKPEMFTVNSVSARSKWEADRIREAFDKPIVAWVDEETAIKDDFNIKDWKNWGWMTEEKYHEEPT